jgi:hypothetical protein
MIRLALLFDDGVGAAERLRRMMRPSHLGGLEINHHHQSMVMALKWSVGQVLFISKIGQY